MLTPLCAGLETVERRKWVLLRTLVRDACRYCAD